MKPIPKVYYKIMFIGIALAGILSFIMDITNTPHITAFWDIFTVWILVAIFAELLYQRRKK